MKLIIVSPERVEFNGEVSHGIRVVELHGASVLYVIYNAVAYVHV